jgi:hypothetical protein
MQNQGATTHTLLAGLDLHLTADFRGQFAAIPREPRRRPPQQTHDFLVICPHPQLTAEAPPEKPATEIARPGTR